MALQIRKYAFSDREAVLNLLRINTPQYFSPAEEPDLVYYLENHAADFYILELENEIRACGGINLDEDGQTAKLSWDIVHPDFQGKGFGSELTRFRIEKMLQMDGIETISVRTSQLVYRFYERFGLGLKQVVPNYWAEGFDLYRMECAISKIRRSLSE